MNKRISKKLTKMAGVRDFTVQEAWDKVIEHLVCKAPDEWCFFIDRENKRYQVHKAGSQPFLYSTNTRDEIIEKNYAPLEPEEVTFYCQSCTGEITAQQDVDNDGECDPCFQGKNEMWAKEHTHQEYEYWNSKL